MKYFLFQSFVLCVFHHLLTIGQKYCLQAGWTSNGATFLAGEMYLNAYGGTDGQCWNTI
ncbi:uncharacterized protein RJT21DRAFT_121073 [Scheffersomyces amazonensis]|uniref:uncharacterized protein n=1 Tax=Scheffersomyces amazonensis TaxID=1078765 RepID=UPI00315D69E7